MAVAIKAVSNDVNVSSSDADDTQLCPDQPTTGPVCSKDLGSKRIQVAARSIAQSLAQSGAPDYSKVMVLPSTTEASSAPGPLAVRLRQDSSGSLQPPTPPATDDAFGVEAELALAVAS